MGDLPSLDFRCIVPSMVHAIVGRHPSELYIFNEPWGGACIWEIGVGRLVHTIVFTSLLILVMLVA